MEYRVDVDFGDCGASYTIDAFNQHEAVNKFMASLLAEGLTIDDVESYTIGPEY